MIGVTCTVVVKRSGAVPRSQGKAVRVKDLRETTHLIAGVRSLSGEARTHRHNLL
jgi:hypothetical protein